MINNLVIIHHLAIISSRYMIFKIGTPRDSLMSHDNVSETLCVSLYDNGRIWESFHIRESWSAGQWVASWTIFELKTFMVQEVYFIRSMAGSETSTPASAAQWWLCKDLTRIGSETTWEGFNGVAAEEANYESLSRLRKKCWTKQQLTQAASAESTQKAVIWECR